MKRRLMTLAMALAVACGSVSGCAFNKASHSGEKKQPISLYLVPPTEPHAQHTQNIPDAKLAESYIANDQELRTALLRQSCRLEGAKALPAAAVPIIIAAGKLAFDLYIDHQLRKQELIKKAAQASYSERLIVSPDKFREHNCALIFRGLSAQSTDFVALVQFISSSTKAFQIQPLYIRARNAVAITGEGKSESPASINVSLAISIKALTNNPLGVPTVSPIGEAAISVPNIEIGPNAKAYTCTPATAKPPANPICPTSDLLAFPEGDGHDISSITISVTETGNVGMDLDQHTAELKALKEALGPAIKDALKEVVK